MSGTLGELLREGAARLRAAGTPGAAQDARILLAAAAGLPRDRLTLHLEGAATAATAARFAGLIEQRARHVPVSRILGRRDFYGRAFEVTPDVLDPRPDTETLVALALAGPAARILDLGTGSGCLLATLLAERPGATGLGTDISQAALDVAGRNACRLGLGDRAAWRRADWFRGVEGLFDLIVSNPPYIAAAEIATLAPEVRDGDPRIALSPGEDALAAYRAILAGVSRHLVPGGRVLVEIGPWQGDDVAELFRAASLDAIAIHPDLDGRPRVVSGLSGR